MRVLSANIEPPVRTDVGSTAYTNNTAHEHDCIKGKPNHSVHFTIILTSTATL